MISLLETCQRPVYVIVFWLVVIVFGIIGFSTVPRDLFPDTVPPQVAVVTVMRGASAEDVNRLVTTILDREIKGISGIRKVTGTSKDEISSINAEFDYDKDLGEAVNDVLTAVSRARRQLPMGIEEPQLFRITEANRPLLTLAVRPRDPQKHDLIQVRQLVENDIKEELLRLPGVGRVDVFGAHEAEIAVRFDHGRLREYDLNPEVLLTALTSANLSVPGGYQETPRGEVLVRTLSEAVSPQEIAQIPVRLVKGGVLRLGDIASVTLTMKTPRSIYHGNGETAIAVNVLKPEGGNSLTGILAVKTLIPDLEKRFPHLRFAVTTDQQPIIDKNFAGMTDSLFSAVWLTMLVVLFMLLDWRTSLIIGVSIPLSFLSTFAFLLFSGYTLNMVTLSGLIIAVGMVVDASIVVVENVYRRLQNGEPGEQAVSGGTAEVLFSIFGGMLTTVVVLIPLMFTGGYVQRTMRPLSLTISTTLIGSFIAAVTMVPLLLRWFYGRASAAGEPAGNSRNGSWQVLTRPLERLVNGSLDSLSEAYLLLLRFGLKLRFLVLIACIAAFGFSVKLAMPLIGQELMPRMDTGMLTMRLDLPPSLSWQQCSDVLTRVESVLKKEPQVLDISSVMGAEPGQISFGAGGQLLQQAEIQVRLTTRDVRSVTIWQIMERWRKDLEKIPEIVSASLTEYGATPVSTTRAPIDVMLTGRDPRVLSQVAEQLMTRLGEIRGLRDLRLNWTCTKPELEFRPNLLIATQLGLTPRKLGELLQMVFSGRVISKLKMEGFLDLPVRADIGHTGDRWRDHIERLFVQLPGMDIDLANLGTTKLVRAVTMLTRENLEQTLDILGSNIDRPVSAVGNDVQKILETFPFPPGYAAQLRGTSADMAEAGGRRGTALQRGMIFLLLVLILLFESWWHPLLVIASIPLALIWGMWGLVIFDKPMCLPALSGFILLGGTIVNNAIILIDFIEQARVQGIDKRDALFDAVRIRLRPIFVTTFSTVLGLLPLTFEQAVGLERLSPLGVVASCGLAGGTLMTLVVIPILYDIVTDLGAWFRGWFASPRPVVNASAASALLLATFLQSAVPGVVSAQETVLPVNEVASGAISGMRLSVRECLELALKQSPVIAGLIAEKQLARGAKEEIGAARRPQTDTAGSFRHWDRRRVGMLGIAPTERQFYDHDLSEFRITIRQLLWDGGQITDRLQASALLAKSRGLQIERARAEITAEVLTTSLGVFTAEALLAAAEKNLVEIRSTLRKMQDMEAVGKVPAVDVLRIQARVQEVLETQEVYRQTRANQLAHLSTVIGSSEAIGELTRDGLPELAHNKDVDVNILVQTALSERADVRAMRLSVQGVERQLRAQKKGNRPQFYLNATANRYGDQSGWGREIGFIGGEFQWTLEDGGRNRGRVAQADAQRDAAVAKLRQTELKVAEQIRTALANLKSAQARSERSQANLRFAEEAFRIEQLKYEQGKGTINDVLDAEAALFLAEAQVIRSQNETLAAQIALETAIH